MGLSKTTAAKLDEYHARLKKGKAKKIKPADVNKLIEKLLERRRKLETSLCDAKKASKRTRIKRKLAHLSDLLDRATWLKEKLKST